MSRTSSRVLVCALAAGLIAAGQGKQSDLNPLRHSTSSQPPRKVIVGTAVQPLWGEYPGLSKRLLQLTALVDRMGAEAAKKYGRGLDLAVLPETAVNDLEGGPLAHPLPYRGAVEEALSRKAREHRCYIVVPMYLLEEGSKKVVSNAAILVGRNGETVGIYRKLHPAVAVGSDAFEDGIAVGKTVPVFTCDFGKLGIQICFDMSFNYGWRELARRGADVVVWPTQSPQTALPAARAVEGRYYVVSSTWRHNASIFEPTGRIFASIREPEQTLVQELDLSYALLRWSRELQGGKGLAERYGDKVGFHYYVEEDQGIFWSNDPARTIGSMVESLGLGEVEPELERVNKLFRAAGVPE